ncbi:hypothetical protein PI125_g14873 [Phytophthora idaei]|nr:hypothetical protein PI125_g14873 [Phytophthora idaei]KAG3144773.1 hypothetical protein PI126_g14006 [Phytophthora idaei]
MTLCRFAGVALSSDTFLFTGKPISGPFASTCTGSLPVATSLLST